MTTNNSSPAIAGSSKDVYNLLGKTPAQLTEKRKSGKKKTKLSEHQDLEEEVNPAIQPYLEQVHPDGGFRLLRYSMQIPLAPIHSRDIRAGVHEVLEGFITRYVPCLGVVLLSVTHEATVIQPTAPLITPTAICVASIAFECMGWRPSIGSRLSGRLVHSTRSHVSLLIHNTFNASIASEHIPKSEFHFDVDRLPPQEHNEPLPIDDFYAHRWKDSDNLQSSPGKGKSRKDVGEHDEQDATMTPVGQLKDLEIDPRDASIEPSGSLGCWVHTATDTAIGGKYGKLDFTVIGLLMANSTISVHGSLLESPFEVGANLPQPPIPATVQPQTSQGQLHNDMAASALTSPPSKRKQTNPVLNGLSEHTAIPSASKKAKTSKGKSRAIDLQADAIMTPHQAAQENGSPDDDSNEELPSTFDFGSGRSLHPIISPQQANDSLKTRDAHELQRQQDHSNMEIDDLPTANDARNNQVNGKIKRLKKDKSKARKQHANSNQILPGETIIPQTVPLETLVGHGKTGKQKRKKKSDVAAG